MTEKVKEVKGRCAVCGRIAVLGNGLCVNCWDENDGEYPPITRKEFFNALERVCCKVIDNE